jgi:hypothetical protein
LALRISGKAGEVAAYLTALGDDIDVTISIEQPPAARARAKTSPGRAKAQPKKEAPVKAASDQVCAVIGCDNPVRSKGYCAAHYQKYNNLKKTGRAAEYGWTDDAPPQSVTNPTLPRGRAAANALSEATNDDVDSAPAERVVKAVPPRIRRNVAK